MWDLTATAKKCIDAGKHIHMDKPASGTLEEYKALLDGAKEKNLVVQLAYMYRYNPAVQKCFELIKEGKLGEIYSINAEMSTFHPQEYRKWLTNFGGGIMYILGSHLIDLIVYILGEPQKVISFLKHTNLDDIDFADNNLAVLEYDKALARVFVSSGGCIILKFHIYFSVLICGICNSCIRISHCNWSFQGADVNSTLASRYHKLSSAKPIYLNR